MTATELKSRREFRCIHRHNGLVHPQCFNRNEKIQEKVGFLDIETTNLTATFGIILSYCIATETDEIYKRTITPEEIKSGVFDKPLLKDLIRDMLRFDRLVTWYGAKFDIPFIRTRCLYHNIDFPVFKERMHTDAYLIAKHRLKMHSNRLGVVAPFLKIPAKEHPLNSEVWMKVLSGDLKAIKFVLTHNTEDVISLKGVWGKINKYAGLQATSI